VEVVQPSSRIFLAQDGEWTRIGVPARRHLLSMLFLAFWLCAWTIGGFVALGRLFFGTGDTGITLFLFFWLCGWAIGWVAAAASLAWMGFAIETLWIGDSRIGRKLSVGFFDRSYQYDVPHIRCAWFKETAKDAGTIGPNGVGRLVMSYGAKEVGLASGVDETEAQIILDVMTNVAGIPQK
jgi:hypothetical protein